MNKRIRKKIEKKRKIEELKRYVQSRREGFTHFDSNFQVTIDSLNAWAERIRIYNRKFCYACLREIKNDEIYCINDHGTICLSCHHELNLMETRLYSKCVAVCPDYPIKNRFKHMDFE